MTDFDKETSNRRQNELISSMSKDKQNETRLSELTEDAN